MFALFRVEHSIFPERRPLIVRAGEKRRIFLLVSFFLSSFDFIPEFVRFPFRHWDGGIEALYRAPQQWFSDIFPPLCTVSGVPKAFLRLFE